MAETRTLDRDWIFRGKIYLAGEHDADALPKDFPSDEALRKRVESGDKVRSAAPVIVPRGHPAFGSAAVIPSASPANAVAGPQTATGADGVGSTGGEAGSGTPLSDDVLEGMTNEELDTHLRSIGVDPSTVKGTGANDGILKADRIKAVRRAQKK